jgi:hypothetical protein
MNRSKSLAIALALQLLALVSLSQTWFDISMIADGSAVDLGAFDGASAYPAAASLSLLNLAALSIVAISTSRTRKIALAILAISSFGALLAVLPMALNKDISALDGQLDRLTGIANTHGLQSVDIASGVFVVLWALCTFVSFAFSIWMTRLSNNWSNQDRATTSQQQSSTNAAKSASKRRKDPIELWDDQRQ